MRAFLLAVTLLVAAPAVAQKRFTVAISEVQAAAGAPADLADRVKKALDDGLVARPQLTTGGKQAVAVSVKIEKFERTVAANPKDPRGQVLTVRFGLSFVGTEPPNDLLVLTGSGSAMVAIETGAVPSAADEQSAVDDVLAAAVNQALDEALAKNKAAKAKKPAKQPSKKKK